MGFDITRTELVWPGKYDDQGNRIEPERVDLPFQVIERVNESRATREREKQHGMSLFDVWRGDEGDTFEDGWRNKLIWGDNKLVMSSLLEQCAGKIDLIYIDPPFATGADFKVETLVGADGPGLTKEQSALEERAYRDTWGAGVDSYVQMMVPRLSLMREMLTDTGLLFTHCDWHLGHVIRILLDEVFGRERFVNEIVWHYYNKYSAAKSAVPRAHDVIFVYSRGAAFALNEVREERDAPVRQLVRENVDGVLKNKRDGDGNLVYQISHDKKIDDVWRIPALQPASGEWTGYPTQKHQDLLERIIAIGSNPDDLVADFFCGSGTTQVVAERMGRRWIASDLGRYAVHVSRKRMLGIEDCKPFEILNLGRYERAFWNVATFGEDLDGDGATSLYEYLAFILRLYGATATSGMEHIHGRKDKAFVHVGAVDAPVTMGELELAVEECLRLKGKELHLLGWEWEMGLNDLVVEEAKSRGVKLVLRQIPNEATELDATAEEGAVRFFELAWLGVQAHVTKQSSELSLELEDFVIPNPELVPDDVREAITTWSDYVDYWAVDWDYADDTFHQGWVTYRTRKDRSLALRTDTHRYDEPGTYRVMVKVIDIFGIDTSTIVTVTV